MASLAAPISVPADNLWAGIDGSWSTYTLRLGTPAQYVRTFLSWSCYQTWAVLPAGCQNAADFAACAATRGGTFDQTASSSWDYRGLYDLEIEQNLGYDGNAFYGYDTVGLPGGPTLANTTVGALAADSFYLGLLGVNPKPTNFTSLDDGSPSYMTLLRRQGLIASVSFAYTAGAPYRDPPAFASLTLGGADAAKFVPNGVQFVFGADNQRDVLAVLRSVSTPSTVDSNPVGTELLAGPIYTYLDATVPQIWLPASACRAFEDEFGLVHDPATDLYLVNDTLHDALVARNASLTFQLAPAPTGGDSVSITLPYASFDLTAQVPYQGLTNSSRYFPLRRAANESQYTLGRAFFQEAYIAVDYESQRFNVSQRAWGPGAAEEDLFAIPPGPVDRSSSSSSSPNGGPLTETAGNSPGGLSGGAIAGVAVAGVAAALLLVALFYWLFRRHRRSGESPSRSPSIHEKTAVQPSRVGGGGGGGGDQQGSTVIPKAELDGSSAAPPRDPFASFPAPPSLASSSSAGGGPDTPLSPFHGSHYSPSTRTMTTTTMTLPGSATEPFAGGAYATAVHEMPGDMPPIREKDGKQLSEKEALRHRERVYNGVDMDVHETGNRRADGDADDGNAADDLPGYPSHSHSHSSHYSSSSPFSNPSPSSSSSPLSSSRSSEETREAEGENPFEPGPPPPPPPPKNQRDGRRRPMLDPANIVPVTAGSARDGLVSPLSAVAAARTPGGRPTMGHRAFSFEFDSGQGDIIDR